MGEMSDVLVGSLVLLELGKQALIRNGNQRGEESDHFSLSGLVDGCCQWRPDKGQQALGGGRQRKLLGVLEAELAMENELGFDRRQEEEEQSDGGFHEMEKV